MCGGEGEVLVVSIETRGQPDAGWLAAMYNTNFKIAIEERKLNLFRKNCNNMPLHTLIIDFQNFLLKIKHFFLNLRVLYMEIFTLKAHNSAKKQPMTEIF